MNIGPPNYRSSGAPGANLERQLKRQAIDALNFFPSVITFQWSYKVS